MLSCPSYYRPFASLVLHSCYGIESKAVAKRILTQPARKNHEVLFFPSMTQEKKRSTFQISQKLNYYRNLLKSLRRTLRVQTLMYSPRTQEKKISLLAQLDLSLARYRIFSYSQLILSSAWPQLELSLACYSVFLYFQLILSSAWPQLELSLACYSVFLYFQLILSSAWPQLELSLACYSVFLYFQLILSSARPQLELNLACYSLFCTFSLFWAQLDLNSSSA